MADHKNNAKLNWSAAWFKSEKRQIEFSNSIVRWIPKQLSILVRFPKGPVHIIAEVTSCVARSPHTKSYISVFMAKSINSSSSHFCIYFMFTFTLRMCWWHNCFTYSNHSKWERSSYNLCADFHQYSNHRPSIWTCNEWNIYVAAVHHKHSVFFCRFVRCMASSITLFVIFIWSTFFFSKVAKLILVN